MRHGPAALVDRAKVLVRTSWSPLAILAIAASAVLAAAILAQWRQLDFDVYLMGAAHLRYGLYTVHLARPRLPFTYPPFAAVLFVPLSHLPLRWAQGIWDLVNIGAVGLLWFVSLLTLRPGLSRAEMARWSVVLAAPTAYLLEPLRSAIWAGNVPILLAIAIVYDLRSLEEGHRRRLPQGVLLGLTAAIKLTPLIFIPYLLATRQTRTAMRALGSFAACCAIGALAAPSSSWLYWTKLVFEWDRPGSPSFISNQSLRGALIRLHHGSVSEIVLVAMMLIVGASGLYLAVCARRRSSEFLGVLVCAATGLAISPISWTYHYVWIVPFLCWLELGADRPRRFRAVEVAVGTLFILGAPWLVPWRHTSGLGENAWQLVVGNSYILAVLVLFVSLGFGYVWSSWSLSSDRRTSLTPDLDEPVGASVELLHRAADNEGQQRFRLPARRGGARRPPPRRRKLIWGRAKPARPLRTGGRSRFRGERRGAQLGTGPRPGGSGPHAGGS